MALLIAVLLGAIAGTALGGEAGAAGGAVLAWLIMRSLRQQREIAALRQTLDARFAGTIAAPAQAA
ncbi:MAG: hypothetical protein ABIO71_10295, partial [Caldimonas sp.]